MSALTARELRELLKTVPDESVVLVGGAECGAVWCDQDGLCFEDNWSGVESLEAAQARSNGVSVLWRGPEV